MVKMLTFSSFLKKVIKMHTLLSDFKINEKIYGFTDIFKKLEVECSFANFLKKYLENYMFLPIFSKNMLG